MSWREVEVAIPLRYPAVGPFVYGWRRTHLSLSRDSKKDVSTYTQEALITSTTKILLLFFYSSLSVESCSSGLASFLEFATVARGIRSKPINLLPPHVIHNHPPPLMLFEHISSRRKNPSLLYSSSLLSSPLLFPAL